MVHSGDRKRIETIRNSPDGINENTSFVRCNIDVLPVPSLNGDPPMQKSSLLFIGLALLATALPLHAQGGCVTSPENPTAILALVGTAGAFFTTARARIKARRSSK
jgi:XrtJ-associated TM-motif-TM protein